MVFQYIAYHNNMYSFQLIVTCLVSIRKKKKKKKKTYCTTFFNTLNCMTCDSITEHDKHKRHG